MLSGVGAGGATSETMPVLKFIRKMSVDQAELVPALLNHATISSSWPTGIAVRLGARVERIDRSPQGLSVQFDDGVDPALLAQTLAVERECCPFLTFDYDAAAQWLTARVADAALDAGLDALADARRPPAGAAVTRR